MPRYRALDYYQDAIYKRKYFLTKLALPCSLHLAQTNLNDLENQTHVSIWKKG